MSTTTLRSYTTEGVAALAVDIEVHISAGLPAFNIVGLPETAVRESKERVRSAILNSKFEFPARRITVNLAPADIPKQGGGFDLPIALGILIATRQLTFEKSSNYSFCGELSLYGDLRAVRGMLPIAITSHRDHRKLICSAENSTELHLLPMNNVGHANRLLDVCAQIDNLEQLNLPESAAQNRSAHVFEYLDIQDVFGQSLAKKALEIAAAGGHNLLLKGPPGSGKSMLAKRMIGILPPLNDSEAIETAVIYSVCGKSRTNYFIPPWRSPHHTASSASLVGGGSPPRPGEVSLAHQGLLFLDELPEFAPKVLEALREPLENGEINISRASQQNCFPAGFQLIAAMNPCPCGYFGSSRCDCSRERVIRYQRRVSGPLLDRIDMQVQVDLPDQAALLAKTPMGESSDQIRIRVLSARQKQYARQGKINAKLESQELLDLIPLSPDAEILLRQAMDKLQLSARGLHKVLRVARTIADLDTAELHIGHIKQALGYRETSIKL